MSDGSYYICPKCKSTYSKYEFGLYEAKTCKNCYSSLEESLGLSHLGNLNTPSNNVVTHIEQEQDDFEEFDFQAAHDESIEALASLRQAQNRTTYATQSVAYSLLSLISAFFTTQIGLSFINRASQACTIDEYSVACHTSELDSQLGWIIFASGVVLAIIFMTLASFMLGKSRKH